jgi:hypothetical protein
VFRHEIATVQLAGKSIALSFSPLNQSEEQKLIDYLPAQIDDANDLPSTLPYNLIRLKAELHIGGQLVKTGGNFALGESLQTTKGLWSTRFGWEQTQNPITAGEYQAIGVDLQGLSAQQLDKLKTKLNVTKTKLEANQLTGLTKHDLTGDLLQTGVQAYLALTHINNQLSAQANDVVYYREPSYGTFATNMNVEYFFGQPRNVHFSGVLMDMDRMKSSAEAKNNCWEKWVNFNKATGSAMSAYEHLVPEKLFSTTIDKAEGVSAVKALALANQQGQRTYTINQQNYQTALPQLTISNATKNEIRTAVE